MTDLQLRQAQRSGDPVAFLRERLRAGLIDRENVRLLAYCGDEAARELCVWEAMADTWPVADWASGLLPLLRLPTEQEAHRWRAVAVAHAVAREALKRHKYTCAHDTCGTSDWHCSAYLQIKAALDAVAAWLYCPCEEHVRWALAASDEATGFGMQWPHVAVILWPHAAWGPSLRPILTSAAEQGVDVRAVTLETVRGWAAQ